MHSSYRAGLRQCILDFFTIRNMQSIKYRTVLHALQEATSRSVHLLQGKDHNNEHWGQLQARKEGICHILQGQQKKNCFLWHTKQPNRYKANANSIQEIMVLPLLYRTILYTSSDKTTYLPHGFDAFLEQVEITVASQITWSDHVTVKSPELLHLNKHQHMGVFPTSSQLIH